MRKYIRVDYTVKPGVDLDELKAAIGKLVARHPQHHPEHRYTPFQHPADPFRFIHIGEGVEEVIPDLSLAMAKQRVSSTGGYRVQRWHFERRRPSGSSR